MTEQPRQERIWTEEIEVAAGELVGLVKKLIKEGNVRRVIIRNSQDQILLEIPLTVGALVGGVAALYFPLLLLVGALAAVVTKVKVQIVRLQNENEE